MHQFQRVLIGHFNGVQVGHGERETGALQQAGGVRQFRERRDPGAGAALDLGPRDLSVAVLIQQVHKALPRARGHLRRDRFRVLEA